MIQTINLIKKLLLTEKTLLLTKKYTFLSQKNINKKTIKYLFELLFNIKILKINTSILAIKKTKKYNSIGKYSVYKKICITFNSIINFFN